MHTELVADSMCHTGESPLWHPDEEVVYWLDIPQGRLLRYDPDDDRYEECYDGDPFRALTLEDDGALLLFEEEGSIRRWTPDGTEPVEFSVSGLDEFRFNDVIADPEGRVFCGIMPEEDRPGALYCLNRDRTMVPVVEEAEFPNGLGFSLEANQLYFTDSYANKIYTFSYDQQSGRLSGKEVFVDTESDRGVPDGLTVDATGNIWSGRWNGGQLVEYDPNGNRRNAVEFPAKKVTSVTFGGADYESAYVTTALASSSDPIGTKTEEGGGAGGLHRADLGIKGCPEFSSRIAP